MSLPLNLANEASSAPAGWTPVVATDSVSYGFSQTSGAGTYYRQGNSITATFNVHFTVSAPDSSLDNAPITIEGLPYTAAATGPGSMNAFGGVTPQAGTVSVTPSAGGSGIGIVLVGASTFTTDMTPVGTVTLIGSVTYFTDDPA